MESDPAFEEELRQLEERIQKTVHSDAGARQLQQTMGMFAALFSPYEPLTREHPELCFELRAKRGQDREWYGLTRSGYYTAAFDTLIRFAGLDTYVGVLPRLGHSGKSEDVRFAAALWTSIDDADAVVFPEAPNAVKLLKETKLLGTPGEECVLPPPHYVMRSGGGLHCLFLLDRVYDLVASDVRERFSGCVLRISRAINADLEDGDLAYAEENLSYLSYLVRVPGSFNYKEAYRDQEGRPRKVRCCREAPCAPKMPLAWWKARLPALPLPAAPVYEYKPGRRVERVQEKQLNPAALSLLTSPVPQKTRHDSAIRLTAILLNTGFDVPDIHQYLYQFASVNAWRIERGEIDKIITHLKQKHDRNPNRQHKSYANY